MDQAILAGCLRLWAWWLLINLGGSLCLGLPNGMILAQLAALVLATTSYLCGASTVLRASKSRQEHKIENCTFYRIVP